MNITRQLLRKRNYLDTKRQLMKKKAKRKRESARFISGRAATD